jgi:hypothetical protein
MQNHPVAAALRHPFWLEIAPTAHSLSAASIGGAGLVPFGTEFGTWKEFDYVKNV